MSTPIRTLVKIDPTKSIHEQSAGGVHNRWHPEIPPYATVKDGEVFKVECHEWTGGQVINSDTSDDLRDVDLTQIHYLSGPFAVDGAEEGDALVVDILDVTPFPDHPWGYTGVFEKDNGGGLFSKEMDSHAAKAIWDLEGIYATSRHIPGVRFAGISHPGLIGTAPSAELLATWNKREGELIASHPDHVPPKAHPPNSQGTYVGSGEVKIQDDVMERIRSQGARTVPGREHGGNVDIKNLTKGSRCFFPVYIKGANLSLGDLHFSQGDGELSFCGAIEMAGIITLKASVIKGGVEKFALRQPIFLSSPLEPQYSSRLIFEGIGVDVHGDGKQYDMDATVAYKQAALNTIAYLMKLGYTREQCLLFLSAAPVDAHVAAIVDSPNAMVTMSIPTEIFDRDIKPSADGLEKRDYGQAAIRSDGVI